VKAFGSTVQHQVRHNADGNVIAWIVFGSVALAVLLAAAIFAKPVDGRPFDALIDLLPIPIYAGSAALALIAARCSTRSPRLGWSLIAVGFISYVLGDSVWAIYEVGFQTEPPAPSLADPFYLAVIPLLLAGIMLLSSSARTLGQFRTLLSASLVVLGLGALVWEPILKPIFTASDTGWPGTLVTAAYPLGDAVLVFAVFVAARRQWTGHARVVLYTFAAGLLLATGSDLGFARMVLNDTYETGSIIDLGWPVGFLLMGLAAGLNARWSADLAAEIHPGVPSTASQRARVAMSAFQATLLGILVFYGFAGGFSDDPSLMVILLAMVSVALLRSALAVADSGMLYARIPTPGASSGPKTPSSPAGWPQ
jgi:hypothetical protein